MPAALSAARSSAIARSMNASRPLRRRVEQLRELAVPLRLEDLEREVLELPLDLPDARGARPAARRSPSSGGRCAVCFSGGSARERPHVVEAVGELDEDDADVLRHRQEHLPDVLGLLLLERDGRVLAELRDAVDELRRPRRRTAPRCRTARTRCPRGRRGGARPRSATGSMPSSARIWAEAIGWVTNGSPDARFWSPCASIAKSIAFWMRATSASASYLRIAWISCSPWSSSADFRRLARLLAASRDRDSRGAVAAARCPGGLRCAPFAPFAFWRRAGAVDLRRARARAGSVAAGGLRGRAVERSTAASTAARREPFRAGRAAGTISAGRSARVRGATMVREV